MAHWLVGYRKKIDFSSPKLELERTDSEELRQMIKDISYAEWQKKGYSKGSLHYMKKNAESSEPFSLNEHMRERLEELRK